MRTYTILLCATALLTACTTKIVEQQAPATSVNGTDPNDPNAADGDGTPAAVAAAISVDTVSLYQGVEVRLVKDGAAVDKQNAPIINNREGIVRVHAAKAAGTKVSKITAKLHVTTGGTDVVLTDGPKSVTTFVDDDLDSTFNFPLTKDQITKDLAFSVELVGSTDADSVKYPADGTTIAAAGSDAPKLRVELVPMRYTADGSNRLPDMSDKAVGAYHDALYSMYPISELELTQHANVDWPVTVGPTGDGWNELLGAIMQMRQDDGVDDDVYYIGVFNPADSVQKYCGSQGCILGVAPASTDPSVYDTNLEYRTALVVGYQTSMSGSTLAQELAHAMARMHAPCGNPAAIDKKFPYKDGAIGTSGWDILNHAMVSSDGHEDFMSYCFPAWVSDYTFKAINDRMNKVSKMMSSSGSSSSGSQSSNAMKIGPLSESQLAWTIQQP